MVGVVLPTTAVAEGDQHSKVNRFHMNMKMNDEFSPETNADEEDTIAYKPPKSHSTSGPFITREWKRVGEWTSGELDYDLEVGSGVTFNMWFEELESGDGGDDARTQFDWTLNLNGNDIANARCGETSAEERTEARANSGLNETMFLAGDIISLYIEYWSFDEINIYYDSAENNSGMFIDGNALIPLELKKKGGNVEFSIADAFNTDMKDAVENYWVQLVIDGETLNTDGYTIESADEEVQVSNSSVKPTLISWPYSGGGKKDVQVMVSYYPHNESSGSGDVEVWDLVITADFSSSSDDDSPGLGFGGALIALAAVSIYLTRRRR